MEGVASAAWPASRELSSTPVAPTADCLRKARRLIFIAEISFRFMGLWLRCVRINHFSTEGARASKTGQNPAFHPNSVDQRFPAHILGAEVGFLMARRDTIGSHFREPKNIGKAGAL